MLCCWSPVFFMAFTLSCTLPPFWVSISFLLKQSFFEFLRINSPQPYLDSPTCVSSQYSLPLGDHCSPSIGSLWCARAFLAGHDFTSFPPRLAKLTPKFVNPDSGAAYIPKISKETNKEKQIYDKTNWARKTLQIIKRMETRSSPLQKKLRGSPPSKHD